MRRPSRKRILNSDEETGDVRSQTEVKQWRRTWAHDPWCQCSDPCGARWLRG